MVSTAGDIATGEKSPVSGGALVTSLAWAKFGSRSLECALGQPSSGESGLGRRKESVGCEMKRFLFL